MAVYNGFFSEIDEGSIAPSLGVVKPFVNSWYETIDKSLLIEDAQIQGTLLKQLLPIFSRPNQGDVLKTGPEENILDTVYLSPRLIDAGLIVDDMRFDVFVWNAYRREAADWDSLEIVRGEGTELKHCTLPRKILPGASFDFDLYVLKNGPVVQDTYYYFDFGLLLHIIYITGKRIVAFEFINEYSSFEISYFFKTVVFRNDEYTEQRRSLNEKMLREEKAVFILGDKKTDFFIQKMRSYVNKILAIPIFNEFLTPTMEMQGETTIYYEEATTSFWGYRNADMILILDRYDVKKSELKQILAKGSGFFTVTTSVLSDFQNPVIFPVFVGKIESRSLSLITDVLWRSEITFKEIDRKSVV